MRKYLLTTWQWDINNSTLLPVLSCCISAVRSNLSPSSQFRSHQAQTSSRPATVYSRSATHMGLLLISKPLLSFSPFFFPYSVYRECGFALQRRGIDSSSGEVVGNQIKNAVDPLLNLASRRISWQEHRWKLPTTSISPAMALHPIGTDRISEMKIHARSVSWQCILWAVIRTRCCVWVWNLIQQSVLGVGRGLDYPGFDVRQEHVLPYPPLPAFTSKDFFLGVTAPPPPSELGPHHSRGLDQTQRPHHSRQESSGRVISSSQKTLPDNTQHSQQTDINASGEIRTHVLSRREAADPSLRPRGHWDRQLKGLPRHFLRERSGQVLKSASHSIQRPG